jgi:hypothetical protein
VCGGNHTAMSGLCKFVEDAKRKAKGKEEVIEVMPTVSAVRREPKVISVSEIESRILLEDKIFDELESLISKTKELKTIINQIDCFEPISTRIETLHQDVCDLRREYGLIDTDEEEILLLCSTLESHIDPEGAKKREELPEHVKRLDNEFHRMDTRDILLICEASLRNLPLSSRTLGWDICFICGMALAFIRHTIGLETALKMFDFLHPLQTFKRAIWFYELLRDVECLNNCINLSPKMIWRKKETIDRIRELFSQ